MGLLSRRVHNGPTIRPTIRIGSRVLSFFFLAAATFAVLLTVSWPKPAQAIEAKPYEELVFPELGEIQIPDYERYELDNGLVVYLMEDHDLPLVQTISSPEPPFLGAALSKQLLS